MAPRMAARTRLRVGLSMHMTSRSNVDMTAVRAVHLYLYHARYHAPCNIHYPRRMLRGCSMPRGGAASEGAVAPVHLVGGGDCVLVVGEGKEIYRQRAQGGHELRERGHLAAAVERRRGRVVDCALVRARLRLRLRLRLRIRLRVGARPRVGAEAGRRPPCTARTDREAARRARRRR